MIHDRIGLYKRDLEKFAAELEAYHDDAAIWKLAGDIKNPAGNLAMHVIGNLNHFVGAVLGNTGYIRNRPAEFETRAGSRAELSRQLRETARMIETVLVGFRRRCSRLNILLPLKASPKPIRAF